MYEMDALKESTYFLQFPFIGSIPLLAPRERWVLTSQYTRQARFDRRGL